MCKGLARTLAMLCLFCVPASLFAQNTPINLNYQNSLLLKSVIFFEHDFERLQTSSATPLGLRNRTTTIDYNQLYLPFDGPSYSLIKSKELIYEYWQNLKIQLSETRQMAIKKLKYLTVDRKVFNALYNKPKVDEKKLIRLAWKKAFGLDVWYPYYKVKEIEDWVKERMSVRLFGFKGKPKFENDQLLYVFKKTF